MRENLQLLDIGETRRGSDVVCRRNAARVQFVLELSRNLGREVHRNLRATGFHFRQCDRDRAQAIF